MTTVLIVDDLGSIREFLKINLSTEPDIRIIGSTDTGESAISQVEEHHPDVVLMDIDMPGTIDGIEATRQITRRFPQSKVLLLTSKDDCQQLNLALQAGSRGYILKNSSIKDIANIIRLTEKGFFQIGPVFGNWNGSLHGDMQANTNVLDVSQNSNRVEVVMQPEGIYPQSGDATQMNHVLSNLTTGLFQLQKTIEFQQETIVNLTNQYSQVQQEIRTKLQWEQRASNNPQADYIPKVIPRIRTRKHLLFITSFFLGVFAVSLLILIIMVFSESL